MCGRYELHSHPDVIALQFGLAVVPPMQPHYNIAPQQMVPVVRLNRAGERELAIMRWGLVPYWSKDPKMGARMINARAETVVEKPAYRDAFRRHRCLVPADAFFEWLPAGPRKQPMRLHRSDGALLGIAGLYDRWRAPDGSELVTCTLLTTRATGVAARIHERMPVIVASSDYQRWLEGAPEAAAELLQSPVEPDLDAHPVSLRVNDVRNDDPGLIEPTAG